MYHGNYFFVILDCYDIADGGRTFVCNCTKQISEEEIYFLTNGEDPYDDNVVQKLFHPNLKLLLVTEGADGCRYYTKVYLYFVSPTYRDDTIST